MTLRQTLSHAVDEIKREVVAMADMALENIKKSLKAFIEHDVELANKVILLDDEVDQYEEKIAKMALRIIWKEQPVAKDLRLVTAILKLITDLERIGDHATDIAEMTLHLPQKHNKLILPITSKMAEIIEKMILDSINALVNVDSKKAQDVIDQDDEVDQLFYTLITKISNELKTESRDPDYAIYILMVAKYLERVGDHAVNIAEWVIFMGSGYHKNTSLF